MSTREFEATRFEDGCLVPARDALTEEAALHIRINGVPYMTTMRTPGEDEHLVRGLLHTESILRDPAAPLTFRTVSDPESQLAACLDVSVDPRHIDRTFAERHAAVSTSSCGLCGTARPRDIEIFGPPIHLDLPERFDANRLPAMVGAMYARQQTFDKSGGSHAAAAFTLQGEVLANAEDIGRHNAVDKVIGALLVRKALHEAKCLLVSGRLSYEIVFKGYKAAIPIEVAVSAPSTLAVETAHRFGMTVIAFCRDGRATIYSHPGQVRVDNADAAVHFS